MELHSNLNRTGRKPVFSEAEALLVLKARRLTGEKTTVPQFIDNEIGDTLKQRVSLSTMHKLLNGQMFPDLIDPDTGQRFDYSTIPRAKPGQPSRYGEDGVDPITRERRHGVPRLRQWLLDKVLEEVDRMVNAKIISQFTIVNRELAKDGAALDARIRRLEDRADEFGGRAGGSKA